MRILLVLAGVVSAIFFVPWITLVCMIILSARYYAWEVVLLGLFVDLLWLPSSATFSVPYFALIGLLLMWGFEPLRKEILY